MSEAAKVGKRGTVVIPADLRRRYGIEEGTVVLVDAVADGVMIRPAVTVPVEVYSPERRAAFMLESWLTPEDYPKLREEVRRMKLDPDSIEHERPE
jgi:AbrB family looped-hinge helix DNA binding protein